MQGMEAMNTKDEIWDKLDKLAQRSEQMKQETPKKRGRGRPPGIRFPIPKHIFMDEETSDRLAELAMAAGLSQAGYVRFLILREAKAAK
jgi:predicted transcriptional regulator